MSNNVTTSPEVSAPASAYTTDITLTQFESETVFPKLGLDIKDFRWVSEIQDSLGRTVRLLNYKKVYKNKAGKRLNITVQVTYDVNDSGSARNSFSLVVQPRMPQGSQEEAERMWVNTLEAMQYLIANSTDSGNSPDDIATEMSMLEALGSSTPAFSTAQ